jgi:hypothetical protein
MTKSVQVLAVPHQLQGLKLPNDIIDPSFSKFVSNLIRADTDFVFEEASGRGPSICETLANQLLGTGHYLDVDPSPDERPKFGIAKSTGGSCPIDHFQRVPPGTPYDTYEWAIVDEQIRREELWVQRVQAQSFSKALLICGVAHGLSVASRLKLIGICEFLTYNYIPYHKLDS